MLKNDQLLQNNNKGAQYNYFSVYTLRDSLTKKRHKSRDESTIVCTITCNQAQQSNS